MRRLIFMMAFMSGLAFNMQAQPDKNAYHAVSALDYYTTEETGGIAVFVPESKSEIPVKIDLVFEFQFINRGYPVASNGISTVPFSMELFREGDNEVTVSFYENEKWVDSRKVNVRVMPGVAGAIKIDRVTGHLVTPNGPLVPVASGCPWPAEQSQLEELKAQGVNLVVPQWDGVKRSRKTVTRFLDLCASLGLWVNYDLGDVKSQLSAAKSPEKQEAKLLKEIDAYRMHPALLSWQVQRDPVEMASEFIGADRFIHAIKKSDPYHPVSEMFSSPGQAMNSSGQADIVMIRPDEQTLKTLREHFRMQKPVLAYQGP